MTTDISVRPIGLSTATGFISSSDAKRDGVPTQLPPQQTVMQADPSARPHNEPQTSSDAVTNKVTIDKAAAAIVFQSVDDRTSEVIGQYPAEGVLRRRAYFRALDNAKADSKIVQTDRKV